MSRIEQYRKCSKAGMSIVATARECGVTPKAVRWANTAHRLGFHVRPREAGKPRILPMLEPHLSSKELSELTFLLGQKYSHRRALEAIRRPDLLEKLS